MRQPGVKQPLLRFGRVLADLEISKGPMNPFTARAVNGLAASLAGLGDFEAALPLNERAVDIYTKVPAQRGKAAIVPGRCAT